MKNRHLIKQGATAAALAMVLGLSVAQSAEVYLQAEQFQKTIPYGTGAGAPANLIPVVNASFEAPNCSLPGCVIDAVRGNYFAGSISGWAVTGSAGAFQPKPSIIVPTAGSQVGWSNGGELTQTLSVELAPSTTYTLTVDVGDRTDSGFGAYVISLSAGGAILAQDNNSLPAPSSGWTTSTVSYTSGDTVAPGQMLAITLDGNGAQEEFDNVRLSAVALAATVTMWGYSECNAAFTICGTPSSPGPQINVAAGDTDGLTVTLRNTLPEASSIMIAGQANPPLTNPAAVRTDGRLTSFMDVVAAAIPAAVTPVAVTNAGFEDPALADGAYNSALVGWTGTGGGTFNPTNVQLPGEASEGSNTHWSNGGAFSQTLAENLQEGTYTLRVDVGDRTDTGFPAYQVQLGVYNGGFVLLAEDNSSLSPSNGFLTSTVTYTASAGNPNLDLPLVIRLAGGGAQVNFDNVRMERTSGAATVATGTYSWPDLRPGTYLYHSGSHVQLQVQMGLYGAMVQDSNACAGAAPCAYPDASYDAQQVLVFSEIDPALHDPAPKAANATVDGYRPQFFLINGEPFDSTALAPLPTGAAGDNILLRLINAGLDNRTVQMLGTHFDVLAEDGHRLPTTRSQYNALLPAAKSLDVMFTPSTAGTYPLFDRRGKLVNGPVHGGGMFHQVVVGP